MFKQLNFDPSKSRGLAALGRSGVDLYPQQFAPMEKVISFTKHVGGLLPTLLFRPLRWGLIPPLSERFPGIPWVLM